MTATMMARLELLEDCDEPTKPSVPSGVRLRAMRTAEDAILVHAREIVLALERRNTNASKVVLDKVNVMVQTVLSWDHIAPEPDVRDRTMIQWTSAFSQALFVLSGGR